MCLCVGVCVVMLIEYSENKYQGCVCSDVDKSVWVCLCWVVMIGRVVGLF